MPAQPISAPLLWLNNLRESGRPGDREAANAFEAVFRSLISATGDGRGTGDRLFQTDISQGGSDDPLIIGRKIVLDGGSGRTVTLDASLPAIVFREGGFMSAFGGKFGSTNDIFWYVGGESADLTSVTKAAAYEYRANESGKLVEGGSGSGGGTPIIWSDYDSAADVSDTVSVIHSDDGTLTGTTNGNAITVTMSYRLERYGTSASDPGSGAISASLTLTRDYDGGGASTVASPSAPGTRVSAYDPNLGAYFWTETIDFTSQYQDTTGDVQDRVFELELSGLTVTSLTPGSTSSVLSIASSEPG